MGGGWNDGAGCEACGIPAMGEGRMGAAPCAGANDGGVIRFPNDEVPLNDMGEPCRAGALGIIVMPGTLTPDALPPPRSAAIRPDW
jgi:hypothetical protein